MPVHEPPLSAITSERERDAEGPVLLSELAHQAALSLYHREHGEVVGHVRRVDFDLYLTAPEGAPVASRVSSSWTKPRLVGPPNGGISVKSSACGNTLA